MLSKEAAKKLTAWGTCEGGRVIWARLKGVFHDMLVVNAYVRHRGRKAPPFMEDTMEQVAKLVREKRKASDSLVVIAPAGRQFCADAGLPVGWLGRGKEWGCMRGMHREILTVGL
eukprot:COSAG05_NODE_173_length_14969_cov_29.555884_12_plen_115_part_00